MIKTRNRIIGLLFCLLLISGCAAANKTTAATDAAATTANASMKSALEIHSNAIVVDTHSDTLMKLVSERTLLPAADIGNITRFHIDIPKLKDGGVDIQTFGAYVPGYALAGGGQDFIKGNSNLLALINGLHWTLENHPEAIALALNMKDIEWIAQEGKLAAVSSIEGAYSLNEETGIELLNQYYDLGVRILAPVWSNSNALGEGINKAYKDGSPSKGGLTDLGKEVVKEMNRLGMLVDVSHMNEETFWGTIEASEAPVIASHSCVFNILNHPRNLKDDQIKAIAKGGGVVQINFYNAFLGKNPASVKVTDVVDHIDYVVKLVGADYVGLGSDFDGADMPSDLQNASMVPNITKELVKRGYSEADIYKILGGNTLRVFNKVWGAAADNSDITACPVIKPTMKMGEVITEIAPTLSAVVNKSSSSELDMKSLKIIVDGNSYIPKFDKASEIMSITLKEPLKEKLHAVTYIAAGTDGKVTRTARIFYIK